MKLDWSALDPKNRSLIALGALAAVLVGAGIGLELVPRLAGRQAPDPEPAEGSFGPWPAPALPPLSASAKPPAKPAGPSASPSPPPSYEKLVGLFEKAKDEPVARKFAAEAKKDPELKKDWEDFEKDQESDSPHQDLEGFAENVTGKAAFRQLVSKFAQDPSFKQLAGNIATQIPELRGAIQRELAHADAAAQLAAMVGPRARQAALAGGRRSGGGAATGALDPTGAGASHLALSETDPGAGGARLSNSAAAAGGQDAGAAKAANAAAGANPGASAQAGAQAHEVSSQLPNPPDVGGSTYMGPGDTGGPKTTLTALCDGKKSHMTKAQCVRVETLWKKYGNLWDACIMAGLYSSCAAMCEAEPKLRCSSPPSSCYTRCMKRFVSIKRPALKKAGCDSRCPDEPTLDRSCPKKDAVEIFHERYPCHHSFWKPWEDCKKPDEKKVQQQSFEYANQYVVSFERVRQCALPGLQIPKIANVCEQYQRSNKSFLAIMKGKHPKYKTSDRDKFLRQLELTPKCKKSPGPWGPH